MGQWKVVRFDLPVDRGFDERLAREGDIDLIVSGAVHSDDEAAAVLAGAQVYHVSSTRNEMARYTFVTPRLLERCPDLLFVSTFGAGFDSVDVAACSRARVAVMNQSGANKISVAEHTLGLALALTHRIVESDRRMRGERGLTREDLMGREIAGRTLGIVGIGNIGTEVARIAPAFGLRTVAADPYVEADEVARRGARKVSFEELLETSDIVSLHCPRDASTIGMMGAAQFRRMKRGAWFISTARGGIHEENALADALRDGHLAGAGLDVWETEPPALEHPLLALPNVIATYHTAGVTHEARRRIGAMAAEQIVQALRGERPPRLVNPEAWARVEERYRSIRRSS